MTYTRKKVEWENPDKMVFESGHKTFDKKCAIIMTGNVYSGTQTSSFVRPLTETKCNGFDFEPGHLRSFDLGNWPHMPSYVRDEVLRRTGTESVIVYEFFHYVGRKKTTHGWVLD